MGKNSKGDFAELTVMKRLIEKGYKVSQPFGDYTYDLVVEINKDLKKVQVKTARRRHDRDGMVVTDFARNKSKEFRYYTEEEVDFFAVYYPNNDSVYWFSFEESPKSGISRKVESLSKDKLSEKL